MGYILPFVTISIKEKQHLLEIDSLKERGILFMDILLATQRVHKTSDRNGTKIFRSGQ